MKNYRRALVVAPYGIGDLLFVTPTLRALRLVPGLEKVDLLLGSRTEEVVSANPHVDEIFSVDKDLFHQRSFAKNLKELWTLGRKLRKRRYDLLLDFSSRHEYAFFAQFFLNVRHRVGFNYKNRALFCTQKLDLPQGFSDKHAIDYFCEVTELAGIPVKSRAPEYYLTKDQERKVGSVLEDVQLFGKSFVVVSPGGGESWGKDADFKRWPAKSFAEFLNPLKNGCGFDVAVLLGSSKERALCDEVATHLKMPAVNLAEQVDLPIACGLISKAKLFVGNDGGLVHVARALDIPILAFYGPVDPKVYGPYPESENAIAIYKENLDCRPCYKNFRYKTDCQHRECLQALSHEEVFSFLESRNFLEKLEALREKV